MIALAKVADHTYHVKIGQVDFVVRRRKDKNGTGLYRWRVVARVDSVWLATAWFDTKAEACRWLEGEIVVDSQA